jgi:hypothetical protein
VVGRVDAPPGRADEPGAGLPLAALPTAGPVETAAAAPLAAPAVDVVPGVAPSVIGSTAASADAPGTPVEPVVEAGGVTPVELGGVEAVAPDGRAVEDL